MPDDQRPPLKGVFIHLRFVHEPGAWGYCRDGQPAPCGCIRAILGRKLRGLQGQHVRPHRPGDLLRLRVVIRRQPATIECELDLISEIQLKWNACQVPALTLVQS
jgi:hypothetical protein